MDALEMYGETKLGLVHVFQSFIIFHCSGQESAISFQNKTIKAGVEPKWRFANHHFVSQQKLSSALGATVHRLVSLSSDICFACVVYFKILHFNDTLLLFNFFINCF
jgi:hypothetical protein